MSIYIHSASQISIQEPLCDKWFETPLYHSERDNRAIDPDYKQYINPLASRRMSRLLKRALTTAITAAGKRKREIDAIITGTGLGCLDNTEKFLHLMLQNNETLLAPSHFIQSTHNTIGSQIALELQCRNYNCTYVHRGISFDSALYDAYTQFSLKKISTALVGAHDEMTDDIFALYDKIGYWKSGKITQQQLRESNSCGSFSGESSVSFFLTDHREDDSLCELKSMAILHQPTPEKIKETVIRICNNHKMTPSDIDYLLIGHNGDKDNDAIYSEINKNVLQNSRLIWYKHLFGESFTMNAIGLYVAAICLKNGKIPSHLLLDQTTEDIPNPKNILLYNHSKNRDHSLILLSK